MFYITLHIYGVCDITVVRIFTPSEKLQKLYAEIVGKYQALQFQSGVNDIKLKSSRYNCRYAIRIHFED